jgi:putative flippase GtrA
MKSHNFLTAYKFFAVGIFNTILGLIIIYSLMYFFGISPEISNFLGYFFGFILGYILNKKWTFKLDNGTDRWIPYTVVILASYFSNILLVHVSIKHFTINSYIAQISGMIIYTTMSYIGLKKIVFARSGLGGNFKK